MRALVKSRADTREHSGVATVLATRAKVAASSSLAAALILSGCTPGDESRGGSNGESGVTVTQLETAEEDTSRVPATDKGRNGGVTGATVGSPTPGESEAGESQQLEVKLEGDTGTRFSGTCVGGQGEAGFEGTVPDSLTFDLPDGGLECSIEKQTGDSVLLRVIVNAGNNGRSVQQINAQRTTINFFYAEGSLYISTESSSDSSISSSSSRSSQNYR